MKRKLALTLLLLLALPLSTGCADGTVRFPEYAETAIDCTFSLTIDGAPYRIRLCRAPLTTGATDPFRLTDAMVTIISPAALAGVTLTIEGQTAHLASGELSIPVRREDLSGILSLFSCFALKNEEITAIRTVRTAPDRTAAVYETGGGSFTVLYDEALIPLSVEYTYKGHAYCLTDFSSFGDQN